MRWRKRHAWGAVLVALFALPVLKPDGVALIEEPAGAFFGYFAKLTPGPKLLSADDHAGPPSELVRELERENRILWDRQLRTQERLRQLGELTAALERSELDRLPRAVLARVLRAHDPYPTRRSILIDRGTSDGVRVGNPVVMGSVLLGRVRAVHAHTAHVQLVTDPRSRLEVFVRTSTGALLRGYARRDGTADGHDRLRVDFVRLREGMGVIGRKAPVFTSNFDERVPAHLLVGLVSEVSDPDRDRMPVLYLRPALDLDLSTEVVVLQTLEHRSNAPRPLPKPAARKR
ncbi:MAG: rod shape-determining protein MreC [Planctomycetota bacterium]|nr:rod shape-determining protein MreC [Planctomycetota bacterium]